MSIYNADKAWLLLADGTVYAGRSFGAQGTAIGEVVFTTGMTGFQETLTDPSYFGQIAVQTFPLIGNYGANDEDVESDNVYMKAYIVREWCDSPSNFRAKEQVDAFLKKHGTIGLFDIDTRALTRRLREHGVMNGAVTTAEPVGEWREELLRQLAQYRISGAVDSVTCDRVRIYPAHGARRCRVALYDFGYKRSIREALRSRGCDVTVVPAKTTLAELDQLGVDGAVLSNGPGDPAENTEVIRNLGEIARSGLPVMGICLGHQMLALAMGAKTEKMNHGHRGGNQPVIDLKKGHTVVTTQNHGHAVLTDSLDPAVGEVIYVNANEHSCEGIRYCGLPVFSVQFLPEACAGPNDTVRLFDEFLAMIDRRKEGKDDAASK